MLGCAGHQGDGDHAKGQRQVPQGERGQRRALKYVTPLLFHASCLHFHFLRTNDSLRLVTPA